MFVCIIIEQYHLIIIESFNNSKIEQIKEIIDDKYYKEIDNDNFDEAIISKMFEELNDPYSRYFSQDKMESLNRVIDDVYVGIGAHITINNSEQIEVSKNFKY